MPSEATIILRNFRLWSFPCKTEGHIHFAAPEHGVLHTVHKKIAAKPGIRELRAIQEMSPQCNGAACVAREQFAGG